MNGNCGDLLAILCYLNGIHVLKVFIIIITVHISVASKSLGSRAQKHTGII